MRTKAKLLIFSSFLIAFVASAIAISSPARAQERDEEALWAALRAGDAVVLMRHALAPGTGDPAGYSLDDCSTQRNLSERGRTEARAMGDRFRANGIPEARVFSSEWCRWKDTAELLNLGEVTTVSFLNSFFDARDLEEARTGGLREWLGLNVEGLPRVLVTHQVNITAIARVYPRSGELIFIRQFQNGEVEVLGRIPPG